MALTHGREITAATVLEINQTHFYLYVAQSGRNHIIEKVNIIAIHMSVENRLGLGNVNMPL